MQTMYSTLLPKMSMEKMYGTSFVSGISIGMYIHISKPYIGQCDCCYCIYTEVRASQLAQASERVGSPIPASQQG